MLAVEQYEIEYTYRQEKDEKLLKFLVLFLSVGIFNFILLYRNIFHAMVTDFPAPMQTGSSSTATHTSISVGL